MASKLGLILTLAFSIQILCFMGDLTCLQGLVGRLDSYAIALGKRIAADGGLTTKAINDARLNYGFIVRSLSGGAAEVGTLYRYQVMSLYAPISFLEPFAVTVTRSTVIGYIE